MTLPLFDDLPPLVAGISPATHETSAAAAESIEDTRILQRRRVLDAIRATGYDGATDDQLQLQLQLDGSSERPRRWELWKQDDITIRRDSYGQPVRRLTRTGRLATVWVATRFPLSSHR